MTFEKANFDPIAQRTYEHYVTHWVSISQGALNREDILRDWHADLGGGAPAGTRRRARAERGQRQRQHRPAAGSERAGAPLLPARRRCVEGGGGAARSSGGCSEWTCEVYRLTAPLTVAGLQAVRPAGRRDRPAGGHLLDSACADAEALDPVAAEREHLRAVPVLLRRQRLEQPAAVQPQRWPVGRCALAGSRARGPARCPARRRCRLAFRASASTRSPAARRRASRRAGCATCSSRCGTCRTSRSRPPRSPPAPSPTSTCCSSRTESRRSRPTRSGPRAGRRCRPGSMAGARTSAGAVGWTSPRGSA